MILQAIPEEMLVSTPKVWTLQGGTRDKKPPHKTTSSALSTDDIKEALQGQAEHRPLVAKDLIGFSGKLYIVWMGKTRYSLMKLIGVYTSLSTASNAWTGCSNCFWKGHDSIEEMFVHHKLLLRTMEYKYREIIKQSNN
eukprot:7799362-Ditylum_brightwellii.AAC.1